MARPSSSTPLCEPGMHRSPEDSSRKMSNQGLLHDTKMPEHISSTQGSATSAAGVAPSKAAYCSNRAELMERLKRGESPTWVPNQSLQQEYLKANGEEMPIRSSTSHVVNQQPSLLPPAEIQDSVSSKQQDAFQDMKTLAMEIQRPRSALHAGDFTRHTEQDTENRSEPPPAEVTAHHQNCGPLGSSPTTPWYTPNPSFHARHTQSSNFRERDYAFGSERRPVRDRAPSLSSFSSSSYILKAPTSPLVQQSNNTDLDGPSRDRSVSPNKSTRRHTLPPHALREMQTSATSMPDTRDNFSAQHADLRENGLHYGHRSRRSLTTNWSLQHSASPPSSAFSRSRRTSFSSEASPLQHASMVGSYEESILRGRMSTAPSKPLDFTAQIGVLGKNDCKPKCPPHVTVVFPAVYYNWNSVHGRSPATDEPSPYVGQIDLEKSLGERRAQSSADQQSQPMQTDQEDVGMTYHGYGDDSSDSRIDYRKSKRRRKTSSESAPPAGSYRIPQQGQIQIIIKNPNKTAVKLFLVPYDLTGMEAGTKTFVRQRLYSAGPVLETPVTDRLNQSKSVHTIPSKKPTLRYLIHLNICCPSAGRFYLYQHIRVVFANRVPDNKEQLTTEIQVPSPKFSSWKPNRLSRQISGASTKHMADKPFRRRSSGFGFENEMKGAWSPEAFVGGSPYPFHSDKAVPPVPPIPFHLPPRVRLPTGSENGNNDSDAMDIDTSRPTTGSDPQSPMSDRSNRLTSACTSVSLLGNTTITSSDYKKLSKEDLAYRGLFGRPITPEAGEGLLAQRLRSLEVHRPVISDDEDD